MFENSNSYVSGRNGGGAMRLRSGLISGFALLLGLIVGSAGATDVAVSVVQTRYDGLNRPLCAATRMNPTTYAALPTDACALGTAGAYGNDRITQTQYDAAGQVTEVDRSVGDLNQIYARYTYTLNGQKASETDANGNKTTFVYDGFDRLSQMQYPSPTAVGTSNVNDYEAFTYDANGNRLSWRRRNAFTISYTYDALNRQTLKDVPVSPGNANGTDMDVYSAYDLLGNVLSARFGSATGPGVVNVYDALGRLSSTTDTSGRAVSYGYNQAGARTSLTLPGAAVVSYGLDAANRVTSASLGSGAYGLGYDDLGRRTSLIKGAGVTVSYGYDPLGRLTSLTNNLAATANDVTYGFAYSPASQITSQTSTGGAYDYKEVDKVTDNRTYNGLNQDSAIAAITGGYDANGNLANEGTATGSRNFVYDAENHLITFTTVGGASGSLSYDPLGRLSQTTIGSVVTKFLYDGTNLSGEYDGAGTLLRRYIHGSGTDEPVMWFEGNQTTTPRYYVQNYQGSVIGYTDASGNLTELYKYGPWGESLVANPATPNTVITSYAGSRFRYTGQTVLTEASLYYYKARVYDPVYGRFLQTDPIGSKDDLDLYDYVADDPVNKTDPTGEAEFDPTKKEFKALGAAINNAMHDNKGKVFTANSANGSVSVSVNHGKMTIGVTSSGVKLTISGNAADQGNAKAIVISDVKITSSDKNIKIEGDPKSIRIFQSHTATDKSAHPQTQLYWKPEKAFSASVGPLRQDYAPGESRQF